MKRSLRWLILGCMTGAMLCGCGAQENSSSAGGSSSSSAGQEATQEFYAMDTYMSIQAYGGDAQEAVNECVQYINHLEQEISRTNKKSEIYTLNQEGSAAVSDETADILNAALELAKQADGYFDPTVAPLSDLWQIGTEDAHVPKKSQIEKARKLVDYTKVEIDGDTVTMPKGMKIDLGGIGKGYAADHVVQLLCDKGVTSGIIALGGNIYVIGQKDGGKDWNVAIADPDSNDTYLGKLSVSDTSVVTSGDYERYFEQDGVRYCHIFDTATGSPAQSDLRSVTIVSDDSTKADAFTTALFVMGYDKAQTFCEENDIEAVFVCCDKTVHVTDGLKDCFTLINSEYTYEK